MSGELVLDRVDIGTCCRSKITAITTANETTYPTGTCYRYPLPLCVEWVCVSFAIFVYALCVSHAVTTVYCTIQTPALFHSSRAFLPQCSTLCFNMSSGTAFSQPVVPIFTVEVFFSFLACEHINCHSGKDRRTAT